MYCGKHIQRVKGCARILSVADVYDALVNERCYKDVFSKEEAYRVIITGNVEYSHPS